jgi:uncharacterized protein YbjQ (UPF0145 family)
MRTFNVGSTEDRKALSKALLMSLDTPPETDIEVGDFLVVVVVKAANVVRDIRENIRNLTGGRMQHYERLIQDAVEEAVAELGEKAQDRGYDGVLGLKISHPMVVDGSVEVIVYGNGFRRVN